MSYKVEEHKLMAYLYGELSREEKEEMDALIKLHPEIKVELDQLEELQGIMGKLEDKEVIEPVIFHKKPVQIPYLKTVLAVAAAISLIIMVGFLTGLKITADQNQLVIQFGEDREKLKNTETLTETTLAEQKIVTTVNDEQEKALQRQIDSLKMKLNDYSATSDLISQQIEKSLNKNLLATKAQLAAYADKQSEVNREVIYELFNQSEEQQKQYITAMLTDYADYIDGRRQEDIQFYIEGLKAIKENYDSKQFETEQLLTNLITTTGQTLPGDYQAGSK